MRIVAGSARGRPLMGPKDARTIRPTADRVRETIFNVLGQFLEGERVLDLFAGTGALAFEALSRGAASAVLVDRDREALRLCQANADGLGFAAQIQIVASPVDRALASLVKRGERFQLIFADPPYAARATGLVLEHAHTLLTEGGVLVLEHDKHEEVPEAMAGLTRWDQRRFGDTVVSMFRIDASPETAGVDGPMQES